MIKSISIQDVTSFSPENAVEIDLAEKHVCLFYGHNGTGKTTIANFLQNQTGADFTSCSLDFSAGHNPEIIVYNQRFIEEHFLESSNQPGVFTLSKENREAEQAIERAQIEIRRLEEEKSTTTNERDKTLLSKKQREDRIKNTVWEAKSKHEHTPLDYCLTGYKGSKEQFFNKVQGTSYEQIEATFDDLVQESKELQNQQNTEKTVIDKANIDLSEIETSPILEEIIVGSEESYLSQLIEKLGNSDWVKQGSQFLQIEKEKCPFCQQELPEDFEEEIHRLFNDTYQEKLEALSKIKRQYTERKEEFSRLMSSGPFRDEFVTDDTEFVQSKERLLSMLEANLSEIAQKCDSPSTAVKLQDTSELISKLNDRISHIQTRIEAFNDKIKNRNAHLGALKTKFWKLIRAKYQDVLTNFEQVISELDRQIKEKNSDLSTINTKIRNNNNTISENRRKITNIELSIENINRQLALLGLKGFEIVKEPGDSSFYRLKRGTQAENIYKSLSEGEKTLIAFLYFIELCQGSLTREAPVDITNRVVVIDDPISSLSHNYIYDIASIIHHKIIEGGYKQIVVLTHSLFFFHELLRLKNPTKGCPKNYKLFRITKSKFSQVHAMERTEILNDYQSYWQAIKDARDGVASSIILPNMMRNILEYYFAFVHQQDNLKNALEELEAKDADFKPLYRYINRESHADAINLTDFGEIDPERFMEKFRKVFEKTGFIEHYNSMMGGR